MGGTTDPITEPPVVTVPVGPSFLDAIDWGTRLATQDVKVYFAGNGEVIGGKTSVGWTGYEQQQAMLAFQQFANVADLHFTITQDLAAADLKLVTRQSAGFLGEFNPPGTRNAGLGVFNHTGTGWDYDRPGTGGLEQGGYGFITLIHEFGHAMGLAHPHDTGGTSTIWQGVTRATGKLGSFDLSQGIFSTMTYNDGWQTDPDGRNNNHDYGWQGTMMGFDVAVLQQKYGANTTFAHGDDGYSLSDANQSGSFWSCIWDTGGTDQISYDGNRSATIDLRAADLGFDVGSGGFVSYAKGIFGGFTIAAGVVIENASGGAGKDAITGNDAANRLCGGSGADVLTGGAGADIFVYTALADSGPARGHWDTITDLSPADKVDLSAVDAMAHNTDNDAFVWIDRTHFHHKAGELRWQNSTSGVMVLADIDGDGTADFKLLLLHADSVVAGDFDL